MKKIKTTILILALGAISIYFSFNYLINSPVDGNDNSNKIFEIKKGENLKKIATNLKKSSFIRNETAFYLYSRYHGIDKSFIAGRFTLSASMTVPEITKILTNSTQGSLVITIQEGHSAKDIEKNLEKLGLSKPGEFIAAINNFNNFDEFNFISKSSTKNLPIKLEGYLFPDTYFLSPSTYNHKTFIKQLLTTFKKKAVPEIESRNLKNRSIQEIITMASIIELEARGKEDSPIISGILWKRLDNNWFLGTDATSLYLKESNIITSKTLQEKSPYNTRKFQKGLPPGPISNPGIESIKAALNPTKTEYWYYLHSPTGKTHYAKNDTEHNINRSKYLK